MFISDMRSKFQLAFICILLFECVGCLNNYCYNEEVHALILARGGSKGIHLKNILPINGVSLIARTIQTIQQSKCFQYIWVSTDNEKIAKEAIKRGAQVHMRDERFAQDNTTSIESIKEFLNHKRTIHKFALFQCTSVFLRKRYIMEAAEEFKRHDCVFAATRNYKLRWQRLQDGSVVPINFNPCRRPRRQDWDGEFAETGMFYFSSRDLVMRENRLQNDRCSIVEIDAVDALEIDEPNDVTLAKCLLATSIPN